MDIEIIIIVGERDVDTNDDGIEDVAWYSVQKSDYVVSYSQLDQPSITAAERLAIINRLVKEAEHRFKEDLELQVLRYLAKQHTISIEGG